MKSVRLRTIVTALVVVSGSAVTGIGLGQFLTKVVLAQDTPPAAPQGAPIGPAGNRAALQAAAAGVRIIYPNPADLNFPAPPNNFQLNPALAAVNPIPLWNFNVTASPDLGGATYSGTVMGRSPFARGKTTTTINVQIVPLIITINNGVADTVVYDPTAADPCVPGHTDVDIVTGSPMFVNLPWTMSGVNVGTTQYHDAFQRAQFWSLVSGTNYHLMLSPTTLAAQNLTFGSGGTSGPGTNYNAATEFGGCGNVGVVNINNLDLAVRTLLTGPLAATVNAGTLPIFLTKNVVSAQTGTSIFTNCCVLGYHSAYSVPPNIQVYSPFSLDTSGTFGGTDVQALSHELAEAINDPTGNNPTPSWGNIGQVVGNCQTNLEVGDPLSPGFGTPTKTFTAVTNGLTYHLQELAYDTWFFGVPSLGAGAPISSNNGTFAGPAKLCPPGGTN